MKRYVLGFAFRGDGRVLLMQKARPDWQAGKLNGIGGKVEDGESPAAAMIREAYEEVEWRDGAPRWTEAGHMEGRDWVVHVFVTVHRSGEAHAKEDEPVGWIDPGYLRARDVVPNLHWLVPMCRAVLDGRLDYFYTGEADA